ncbi:MAG: site-specific integrase [Rhodospirillaceae bacterium]
MAKLTKKVLDALRPDPDGRELFVWDGALAGFGVRVLPSGVKSYLIQYRTTEGRTRRLALGKVGTLTPDEAREAAREKLAAAAKGADPSGERHAARTAMTVTELCDWYLDAAAKGDILGRRGERIKASTLEMDRSRIDTHVKPLIGHRTADSLADTDIAKTQRDIAAGKTAKAREGRGGVTTGGAGVAARTVRMLGAIFEHACRAKLVKANPAQGVRQLAEGTKDRRLSEDEIRALGKAIRDAEARGESSVALAAIRFLLLTGFRRNEALALTWDAVDIKGRCIQLADSKSGAQIRAVGSATLSALVTLTRAPGATWVFPGARGEGHFVGLPKVLERLCALAGIEGASLHVLRHTFASVAADEGFSEMTVAALLGHARRGVTQRYAKVDRAAVLAADAVAAKIAGLLDGVTVSADVVPMISRAG